MLKNKLFQSQKLFFRQVCEVYLTLLQFRKKRVGLAKDYIVNDNTWEIYERVFVGTEYGGGLGQPLGGFVW